MASADSNMDIITPAEQPLSHIRAVIAHGVLMIAAFALLLPLGNLVARHKWMFGSKQGGISKLWFQSHVSSQVLGSAVALAGLIVAVTAFSDRDGRGYSLYGTHKGLGYIAVVMVLFQAVIAFIRRPLLGSRARSIWTFLHGNWGRIAMLLGIADLFVGAVLVQQMYAQPLWAYAGATLGIVGAFVLLLLLVLEPMKMRLQRRGRYDPVTHGYAAEDAAITKQPYDHKNGADTFDRDQHGIVNAASSGGPVFYAEGGPATLPADMEIGMVDGAGRKSAF